MDLFKPITTREPRMAVIDILLWVVQWYTVISRDRSTVYAITPPNVIQYSHRLRFFTAISDHP